MSETTSIAGGRIALFGGSFDPPHAGHLAIARAARQALSLDSVLFTPVGAQPLKPLGSTASYKHRVAMTELAIAKEPGFHVSLLDAPTANGAPNYTIDTLHALRMQMDDGTALFCLMGADSLYGLRRWYHAAEIPFAASLIVASRPGESLQNLSDLLPMGISLQPPSPTHVDTDEIELLSYTLVNTAGTTATFYLLPGLHVDVSASQIRTLLQHESGDTQLLLPEVARYIAEHHLYE